MTKWECHLSSCSKGRHNDCAAYLKTIMIRKLKSGEYRLYSRKKNPKTNKRRNLGTFSTLEAAKKHERDIQYFKRK
jgi:hypothetical protein